MKWWYSQQEDCWYGPNETREDAILEGQGAYGGEAFMVQQAEQGELSLEIDADWILDRLSDSNEEYLDPDSYEGVFCNSTLEQRKQLTEMVTAAVREWAIGNNLDFTSYMFTRDANRETISATTPEAAA